MGVPPAGDKTAQGGDGMEPISREVGTRGRVGQVHGSPALHCTFSTSVLTFFLGIAFSVHGTPLFSLNLQCFLWSSSTLGCLRGVAVPAAFPGIRFSSSSPCVMPAATSPCGTIVAWGRSGRQFCLLQCLLVSALRQLAMA